LLGRKNVSVVNEVPLIRREIVLQNKETLRMQKIRSVRKKQKAIKKPLSKVSIKHFY